MEQSLFDRDEYDRWLEQAEHTLASAQRDLEEGDFAWACFKAQQAAEYAVKGLLRGAGLPALGHSILKLLREGDSVGLAWPSAAMDWARTLDRHYIPPRYPDAYAAGSPFEFYDESTAEQAITAARNLVRAVRQACENL